MRVPSPAARTMAARRRSVMRPLYRRRPPPRHHPPGLPGASSPVRRTRGVASASEQPHVGELRAKRAPTIDTARGQRIERWFQVPKTCVLPIGRPPMGHSSVGAMAVTDDLDALDKLPRWDLTPLFPGVDSRELAAAQEAVGAGLTRLTALYDEHDVRGAEPHAPSPVEVAALEEVLAATNELHEDMRPLTAYLYGLTNTDTRDEQAAGTLAAVQAELAPLRTLSTRFAAWVATLGADNLIEASTAAADHAWPLRKAELAAVHQMTEAEEDLAAELNLTGASAWNRLHGDVSGRLHGDVHHDDGSVETLPITVIRNLAGAPEAAVRRAAYDAELLTWKSAEVPLAAAMNGIKGEANTLNRR